MSAARSSAEHVIVDGYNVIFRSTRLRAMAEENLERAREELVRAIDERYRQRPERVTVVFDTREHLPAHESRRGGVRVIFANPGETADVRIQALVDRDKRRSGVSGKLAVRVVTSDNEVAGRARLWGAKAVSVASFLVELKPAGQGGGDAEQGESAAAATGAGEASGGDAGAEAGARDPGAAARPRREGKRQLDEWERLFERARDDDEE